MHYADYKTVLSPKNGLNLYRGCAHGCVYCDSRSRCYNLNHCFEDIEVKKDALAILEKEIRKRRGPCQIITGSMCDPYIPLEEELKLTQGALELVSKYHCGISILTKSARILRDIDLLKEINEKTKCVVSMTLTTFDEELCKKLEPNVSTTKERFQALEALRDAGIPTVVWMCPILPFINDSQENLLGLLDYCIRAKVTGILCFGFGTTIREGSREYFYKALDKHFPGLRQKYIKAFGDEYECRSPNEEELWNAFVKVCQHHKIMYNPKEVFAYLRKYENKTNQLSFFDEPPPPQLPQ